MQRTSDSAAGLTQQIRKSFAYSWSSFQIRYINLNINLIVLNRFGPDELPNLKADSVFSHYIWLSVDSPMSGALYHLKTSVNLKYNLGILRVCTMTRYINIGLAKSSVILTNLAY